MSDLRTHPSAIIFASLSLACSLIAVACGNSGSGANGAQAGNAGTFGATGGATATGGSAQGGHTAAGGTSTGGAMSSGGTATGGSGAGGATATGGAASNTLSARYPNDVGLSKDASVLFYDDFEGGWGKWSAPKADTQYLHLEQDATLAEGGTHYLRSTVTATDLASNQYISSSTRADLPSRVNQIFWRFYARFRGIAPNPHHWVRVAAGTPTWASSGLANTVPPGDQGYWFDFDASNDDVFNFYVYWYLMRSGRCNDGTAVPGCAGDQGTTYYYGNMFQPPNQTAFPRDKWFCIEIMGKGNTVGSHDGALAFYIDGQLVGDYRQGYPNGTWLRDNFFTNGCSYSACTPPAPFEGFEFRSNSDVLYKQVFLDAYYELGSFQTKKAYLQSKGLSVSDEQTIYYDDVVVATERIGCKVKP